jgi:hypothetical protein
MVADWWRRHETTLERGAAVFGLVAIAIAQPIFEVVSNTPEFLAARGTNAVTVAAAVFVICLLIPFVLFAVERAIRFVSRRTATAFHSLVLALLSAAIVMPWLRRSEVLSSPRDALVGTLVGAGVALAAARVRVVRQFLTALGFAAVSVPVLFLADPDTRQSVLPSTPVVAAPAIERTPPIVFVLFDELPLVSLLDAEGNIDAERYPNFAALAHASYWYRNTSTVASNTIHAVPAILSGRYPATANELPTAQYYPVNLFTTLVDRYDISAFFRFQNLCPPRACRGNAATAADTVGLLVSDLSLVWLHIVLPAQLTERLPPVTYDWGEFARAREARVEEVENGRAGLFAEFVASIDGRPARLHFIHSMLPHMALEYVPSGRRYHLPDYETVRLRQSRLFEKTSAAYADMLHQRHLAQVAFVDRLIGDLMTRLRAVGAYDRALVVVTADHGASYREGRSRREPEERNLSDILLVPLLVKLPGQQRGEVVDRIVETVDILPTILDVVGVRTPLRFDGRSLVDPRVPPRTSRTFIWRNRLSVETRTIADLSARRDESLGRKERRFGRGNLTALYAPPASRHLLGLTVSRSAMSAARDVQITIRNRRQFAAVDLARDPLPLYVTGVIETPRAAPLTVAVVVNGVTAAVTQSYRERDAHMFGTLIPESSLRDGNNNVTAFVVDTSPLIHPREGSSSSRARSSDR